MCDSGRLVWESDPNNNITLNFVYTEVHFIDFNEFLCAIIFTCCEGEAFDDIRDILNICICIFFICLSAINLVRKPVGNVKIALCE